MYVVIAEKSSQAESIAQALNLTKQGGVYQGVYQGAHTVLWAASGHLVKLSPPENQICNFSWDDPKTHEKIPRSVPFVACPDLPATDYAPPRKPSERINLLKKYIDDAEIVIGATDPDREGELIYRSILEFIGYQGKLERVWLSRGLTSEAIVQAFQEKKCASHYNGEYYSGLARTMGDYGSMVLTSTYTYYARRGALGRHLGTGSYKESTTSVGRVQTTCVAIVNSRYIERQTFTPTTHYKPVVNLLAQSSLSFQAKYSPQIPDDLYGTPIEGVKWDERNFASMIDASMNDEEIDTLSKSHKPTPLFTSEEKMQSFIHRIQSSSIVDIDVKESYTQSSPPKPLSMTKLQSLISSASAIEVLAAGQRLYEKGYTSYPRTEESELSEDLYNQHSLSTLCSELSTWQQFGQMALAVKSIHTNNNENHPSFKPKFYTSSKKAHDALHPVVVPKPGTLSGLELEVFEKITTHYLQAHLPPSKYFVQEGYLALNARGLFDEPVSTFKLKKSTCVELGWEYFNGKSITDDVVELSGPELKNLISVTDVHLKESVTKKPPLYTEASLLFAMYHAAKFETDPELRNSLRESKGIGTPATRPSQIATILLRGYILKQGGNLDISQKGIELCRAVPEAYRSPGTTAKWEMKLKDIASAAPELTKSLSISFIDQQLESTEKLIKYLNENLLANTPKKSVNPNMPLSQKTKEMLLKRQRGLGIQIPRQALVSEVNGRKWLDSNPWIITKAMVRKIHQIVTLLNIEAPVLKPTDFGKAIEFINLHGSKVPSTPAPGSIKYAKQLANETGLSIPTHALTDARRLSEFITAAKKHQPVPKSTIKSIQKLALELKVNVGLSNIKTKAEADTTLLRLKKLKQQKN